MARQKLTDRTVAALKPAAPEQRQYEVWDAVLPSFGIRVGSRGNKAFVVMARVDGKLKRTTLGRYPHMSLADARKRAGKVIEDAACGIDQRELERSEKHARERQRRNTFGAVAADFMVHHAIHLRTKEEMQRKLDQDILPAWRDLPIRSITRSEVRQMLRDKAATAPIAANRVLALISTIFNWAIDEEIVEANPAARMRRPAPEVERERSLSDDELRSIWRAADQAGYPFGPLVQLLILTGQRRGEVASLQWSDIRDAEWHLPNERTKSGRGHAVPLSSYAMRVLEQVPQVGSYVFSSGMEPRKRKVDPEAEEKKHRRGDKAFQGWSRAKARLDAIIGRQWVTAGAQREPGVEAKGIADWRLHDIRRTVATGMRTLGVDRLTVSKILNHREAGITKVYDRYAGDPEKRRALEHWGRHVEDLFSARPATEMVVPLRPPI